MATPPNTDFNRVRKVASKGQTVQEAAPSQGRRLPTQQPVGSLVDTSIIPSNPTKGDWYYDPSARVIYTMYRGEKQLIAALFAGTPETHANGRLVSQAKIMRSGLLAISRGKKAMLQWLSGIGFPAEINGEKTEDIASGGLAKIIGIYLIGLTKEKKGEFPIVK